MIFVRRIHSINIIANSTKIECREREREFASITAIKHKKERKANMIHTLKTFPMIYSIFLVKHYYN